jgi:phage repressor protein C with HTH and peptisase S24 domain
MELDPVRLKVLALLKERGRDFRKASLAMGRNAAYIHQYLYRGSPKVLSEDDRIALAEHLGIDEDELRHQVRPRPQTRPSRRARRVASDTGSGPLEGFSKIAEIDVRASAGPGALLDGFEETKDVWYFPDAMIRHEFRARAGDLRIITIDGDSMEPVLSSGDRLMVDTSQRVPVPPGIFVIWDGIGIVAKRIEHILSSDPAKLRIMSVNPDYETYERDAEEVNVIGRVVWSARRH